MVLQLGGSLQIHLSMSVATASPRIKWRECQFFSEPDISNMASVPRQILEAVKTFKTLERYARHIAGFGEAQVDRYSRAAIFPRPGATPANEVAADPAEVEGKRSGAPDIGGKSIFGSRDMNAVVFIIIGPESAGTAASGAVADLGIGDFAMNGPMGCSTKAVTMGDFLRRVSFLLDIHPRLLSAVIRLSRLDHRGFSGQAREQASSVISLFHLSFRHGLWLFHDR